MSVVEKDKKEAAKKLKQLANSYSDVNDMAFDFSSYGFKYIDVPKNYGYKESQIAISGTFYKLYKEFIKFLESEKKLEYMINNPKDKKSVEGKLNKFVIDVLLDKKYRNSQELDSRIKETLDSIYKPLNNYKIIIPIKYFHTEKTHVFEIEDSVISKLDLDNLKKDAAYTPFFESLSHIWDKFENNYCITISEEGNNNGLVIERARKKAFDHLDFLRLYSYEMPYRAFAARYFSISEVTFIYSNGKFIGPSFNRDEKLPIIDKLDDECVNNIYNSITELQKLNQIENTKTRQRIRRTIHWLGKAITETDLDISLILYCTALESLLIPEVDGRKGELLALRVALIEKKFIMEF
jgi:hypothetical protein